MEDPLYGATLDEKLERIAEMLRAIADEEPEMRRRVRALRETPGYREPFEKPDPLVSIVIPTYQAVESLGGRSLPSALAQTHANIEVVVVGDAAPPEIREAIEQFRDPRVRFENLPLRGPYPDDPDRAWLVAGSSPFNAGVALARGDWIAPLGDDDAFTRDHVALLLRAAVERRLELVYSPLRAHLKDGRETLVGEFPPRLSEFGLQGALYHSGLSFMELNLSDDVFDVPNDWSLCRRMLRAGVRIGMIDTPTVDYYPSRWGVQPQPMQRRAELASAQDRVLDLERQLAAIASSKSWRLTGPLRAVASRIRGARRGR